MSFIGVGIKPANIRKIEDSKPSDNTEVPLRKKSHISLAKYIVDHSHNKGLKKHRYAFYIGSILPDIKPSFFYRKHEFTGTFPPIQRMIHKLSEWNTQSGKCFKRRGTTAGVHYYLKLGQVSHYLADYFTFPHNRIYKGGLREHNRYERDLKHGLKKYLRSKKGKKDAAKRLRKMKTERHEASRMPEQIISFIQIKHDAYLDTKLHTKSDKHHIKSDIHHIVEVNQRAIEAILSFMHNHIPTHSDTSSASADSSN